MVTKCGIVICLFILITSGLSEIHRAKPRRQQRQSTNVHNDSNFRQNKNNFSPWFCSFVASGVVGFSGVLPLLFITGDSSKILFKSKTCGEATRLPLMLSFAVGGLLGDVFLHLLPEAWNHLRTNKSSSKWDHVQVGLWVLVGMLSFFIIEMMASEEKEETEPNKCLNDKAERSTCVEPFKQTNCIHVSGYLNLVANCIDNFTHGLAVGGSFLVSFKMGVLTTAAILIHEIPHEVGDFAILLRAGFSRWDAAKAQIGTAAVGMLGSASALLAGSSKEIGDKTWWILPFTAGGFLNIALINVLPDLLKESDYKKSLRQTLWLIIGILTMGGMTLFVDTHN